jgi:hypothetical protein
VATKNPAGYIVGTPGHKHIALYLGFFPIRLFDLDFTAGELAGFGRSEKNPY